MRWASTRLALSTVTKTKTMEQWVGIFYLEKNRIQVGNNNEGSRTSVECTVQNVECRVHSVEWRVEFFWFFETKCPGALFRCLNVALFWYLGCRLGLLRMHCSPRAVHSRSLCGGVTGLPTAQSIFQYFSIFNILSIFGKTSAVGSPPHALFS
jgi:hypothetical protein